MTEHEYFPLAPLERHRLYKRLVLRGILSIITLVVVFYGLPKILPYLGPFVFALVVAMILNPVVGLIEQKLHISRRISALVLTVVVVGALFFVLGRLIYTIVNESVSLADNINSIWSYASSSLRYLNEKMDWLAGLLPVEGENVLELLNENLYVWVQSFSTGIMDSALGLATGFTSKISNIFLSIIMSLLAVYFTISDYPKLARYAKSHVDSHMYGFFKKIKGAVQSALGGYLKAQLLLALLAFVIMFAALALYGQRYALLIAIALGVVDFLPIVGTIAVLLPWAVIELLGGNLQKAAFLLILGVGFFLLRRIVEPKIVGSQTGLHPLIALISIFIGMKLSGVWGAILGPVVVMITINIYKSGIFDNTVADVKELYHLGRFTLKRDPRPE